MTNPAKNVRKQNGFTLIELLIVVGALSIILAIAIPAYQDYTVRGYVNSGLAMASTVKTALTEFYDINEAWPRALSELEGVNNDGQSHSDLDIHLSLAQNGIIILDYQKSVRWPAFTVRITPKVEGGAIMWTCRSNAPQNIMPHECRNN